MVFVTGLSSIGVSVVLGQLATSVVYLLLVATVGRADRTAQDRIVPPCPGRFISRNGRPRKMTDDDRRAIQDAVMETMLDNDHNGLGRCYGGAPTPIVGARVAAALDPWLADHDRAVRVAALTEAADELQRADYEWENAADFVRARASAL